VAHIKYIAKNRVKKRVAEGGHNIEQEVIERRYVAGIRNLFEIYLPIVDDILIFDNSEGKHELIAEKSNEVDIIVLNRLKYNKL
jgi:predicted ABC-type ATPase